MTLTPIASHIDRTDSAEALETVKPVPSPEWSNPGLPW